MGGQVDNVRRSVLSETGNAVSACGADCAGAMSCVRWVVMVGSDVR